MTMGSCTVLGRLAVLGRALLAAGLAAGCSSTLDGDVDRLVASFAAEDAAAEAAGRQGWHRGPDVAMGGTGTARFVPDLLRSFQVERCMETVRTLDQWFREPANDGYEASIDHILERLRSVGFGSHERLALEILETERAAPAWTPLSASLAVVPSSGDAEVLHAFDEPAGRDRCMLPVNAPSCDLEGRLALDLDHLEEGSVLVTEVPARQVLRRAGHRGAAAIVSASLYPFNEDPTGAERHLDAIQYTKVPAGTTLPVFQISKRTYRRLVEVGSADPRARLRLRADVRLDERPLRTVVARIDGVQRPEEAVVVVSHVQEPGACDNASGVAGLVEGARSLSALMRKGDLDWPDRTLVFLWGDEFRQSRAWLDDTSLTPVAALSSDMTGQSREKTGAIALLEREPDPGALVTLPPDEHTPWGAGEVLEENLLPSGLSVIGRCAMADVARREGDWITADHPWEGGSDHDVFIDQGVPAVLFWHFTDFAYHTSLDRLDMIDPGEIRRTTAAILATAMAVADPEPADLDRYLESVRRERQVRTEAARAEEDEHLEELWIDWCRGARYHLRELCLGLEAESGDPTGR